MALSLPDRLRGLEIQVRGFWDEAENAATQKDVGDRARALRGDIREARGLAKDVPRHPRWVSAGIESQLAWAEAATYEVEFTVLSDSLAESVVEDLLKCLRKAFDRWISALDDYIDALRGEEAPDAIDALRKAERARAEAIRVQAGWQLVRVTRSDR